MAHLTGTGVFCWVVVVAVIVAMLCWIFTHNVGDSARFRVCVNAECDRADSCATHEELLSHIVRQATMQQPKATPPDTLG